MSNVVTFSAPQAAALRVEAGYVTAWSDYYRSARAMLDRDKAMDLADSHVEYLKKRDAEILAGVAEAMGEKH
jgi:hypothetical protein